MGTEAGPDGRRGQRRRWLQLAAGGVVFVGVFLALRRAIGLEFEPESMRSVVSGLGLWAPLAFVGIVVFRVPLGVPSQLVLIGGGLVFGPVEGTLYGAAGLLVSGLTMFLAARWTGRASVESRLPLRLRYLLDVAGSRLGALFIALGTAYPLGPITTYHLVAGVTGMALPIFAVALAFGSLVRAAVYTWFGSTLMAGELDQLLLASVLLAAALLLPLAFRTPREWLLRAVARPAPGASAPADSA